MTVQGAKKAREAGVSAIVVSNHGGGEEGVASYIRKISGELSDAMSMCGAFELSGIRGDMVRR